MVAAACVIRSSCCPPDSCCQIQSSPCCWIMKAHEKHKNNKKKHYKIQVFKDLRKEDKTLVKKLPMKPPACVERIRAQSRDVLLPAWRPPRPRQRHRRASLPSHPAPCSTPSLHRAQMSMQFTAHSKLDHSSGVLFGPGTCYFSPSLFKKKNQTKKSAVE